MKRFLTCPCLERLKTLSLQLVDDIHSNQKFVFDDENRRGENWHRDVILSG
jgi:hypothetical protein